MQNGKPALRVWGLDGIDPVGGHGILLDHYTDESGSQLHQRLAVWLFFGRAVRSFVVICSNIHATVYLLLMHVTIASPAHFTSDTDHSLLRSQTMALTAAVHQQREDRLLHSVQMSMAGLMQFGTEAERQQTLQKIENVRTKVLANRVVDVTGLAHCLRFCSQLEVAVGILNLNARLGGVASYRKGHSTFQMMSRVVLPPSPEAMAVYFPIKTATGPRSKSSGPSQSIPLSEDEVYARLELDPGTRDIGLHPRFWVQDHTLLPVARAPSNDRRKYLPIGCSKAIEAPVG